MVGVKKKKISFKTRKGKTVTYDGHKTTFTKARKGDKLLTDWKPIYFPEWAKPHHISWSDIGDLFYDFMKVWFIFFLMLGWAGIVLRFLMWIYGG